MKINLLALFILSFYISCSSEPKKEIPKPDSGIPQNYYPAGQNEKVLDENGKEVTITNEDHPLFQKESKSKEEIFRVVISSDYYKVRQIRQTENMKRIPDLGGDAFMMEELQKYNKKDFTDDGIIKVSLNSKTGKIEKVNTDRNTRIQQLLKIIQNDSTRWVLEHKNPEPSILNYNIVYNIVLFNKSNRELVKEELKKEVKK